VYDVIEKYQIDSCRDAGYLWCMNDVEFPLSGDFVASEDVQRSVTGILDRWGVISPWPPIQTNRLHGLYQEKVTIIFLKSAWAILQTNPYMNRCVQLERDIFLATAPTGLMQAKVKSRIRQTSSMHAIIFDVGLYYSLEHFIHAFSTVCRSKPTTESQLMYLQHNLDPYSLDLSQKEKELDYLADLFAKLVDEGNVFSFAPQFTKEAERDFCAIFLRDAFCFLLSHEYHHIHLRHFDPSIKLSLHEMEHEADQFAFADTCGAIAAFGRPTIGVYYNIMIMFFFFDMLYRSIHLKTTGKNYEGLSKRLQYLMQLSEKRHPHPRIRRFILSETIYKNAETLPEDFGFSVALLERLFLNIWEATIKKLYAKFTNNNVHVIWKGQVESDDQAYAQFRAENGGEV